MFAPAEEGKPSSADAICGKEDIMNKRDHLQALREADAYMEKVKDEVQKHPWRQDYHYSPTVGWINDPCGLVQIDGYYHMLCQHYPFSGAWGMMYLSHARSKDLVHWERLPEAVAPSEPYDYWDEKHGGVYTCCGIDDEGVYKIIYTGHTEAFGQVECLATAEDGIHFQKYEGNPILSKCPEGMRQNDFRDTKVWKRGKKWYLTAGTTDGKFGRVALYHSDDLIHWEFQSFIWESRGEYGSMPECPNFFEVDGKWVLIFAPLELEDRKAMYLVGDFDYDAGRFFPQTVGEVDWGLDYYAPQVFKDDMGRTLMMGWMESWSFHPWYLGNAKNGQNPHGYVYDCSEIGFNGSISTPRTISVCHDGKLKFDPVPELKTLRKDPRTQYNMMVKAEEKIPVTAGDNVHCEIFAAFDLTQTSADVIGFGLRSSREHETLLEFDLAHGEIIFDRTRSGNKSAVVRKCNLESVRKDELIVHIYMDSTTIELFTDDNRTVMTNCIYSPVESDGLYLYAKGGDALVSRLQTWGMEKVNQ